MSDYQRPGLDAASTINAFLSKIHPSPKTWDTSVSRSEEVEDKAGELNVSEDKASDLKANGQVASALPSTVTRNMASPESKASEGALPAEKITEWLRENAPSDHFKSKNAHLEHVQAQATPYGSPLATGVLAPPSSPETLSNLAIGKLISAEIDKIPEERFSSLGDSRYAPRNPSLLSTAARSGSALQAQDHFFSAIPRATKSRDDPAFTRMSFKAADTPTIPAFVNPNPSIISVTEKSIPFQGISYAVAGKENLRGGDSQDRWSRLITNKGSKASVPNNTPVVLSTAPLLKPNDFAQFKAPKAFTPDTPDDKLDVEQNEQLAKKSNLPPQKALREQSSSSASNIPSSPPKEDKATKVNEARAAIAKPIINIKTQDLANDTAGEPLSEGLTPSSVTFTAISPSKARAAGITTATTGPAKTVGEDLEGALYFKAWPKSEGRPSRTAKHRKIHLNGIPRNSTTTFVASLVFGGPLESISVGMTTATVVFLHSDDAMKYYDATGNGLLYKKNGVDHLIMTELGKDVDPVSGILREWVEKEFTRCVRAIGVDKDWDMASLQKTAENKGRKVEKIIDGANVNNVRGPLAAFFPGV
ncbi:MAG: hypothetical protein Q9219_004150 [cf. Caloplaca sp. 3 TL-2023]